MDRSGVWPTPRHDRSGRTRRFLDAPFKNPKGEDLTEVEVTDPTHPLYQSRFPLLSRSSPLAGEAHVFVAYRGDMRLKIPLSATNLAPSRPASTSKLTPDALLDLVALATECEVLCPSTHDTSGSDSPKPSAKRPSRTSPRSFRR